MAKPVRHRAPAVFRVMFPDVPDWPESPRTALLAFSSAQTFRVEELVRDNHYVILWDAAGHVWVEPPGTFTPAYQPADDASGNAAIAAVCARVAR